MGLFSRKRYVVATLLVGLEGEGRQRVFEIVGAATRRIAEQGEDFEVTLEELVRVAEVLLEFESSWSHVANWGEAFGKEEEAAAYGDDCFADAAGRYLGSGSAPEGPVAASGGGGTLVVTLTVGYPGQEPAIEKTLATRLDLSGALAAIVALARKGRLELAHVHQAPAAHGEVLTEDRLLMNYPELLGL